MPVNDFNINALVGFNGNERKVSYQYSEVNDLTIPTWFNLKNSGKNSYSRTAHGTQTSDGCFRTV